MNREFYQAVSRAQAIRTAKRAQRPLEIWPGDSEHVTATDLPDVSNEYVAEHPPHGTIRHPHAAFVPVIGNRYAVLTRQYGEIVIGVWRI